MAELACITKELDFHLEQVQDFTPTPMTVATEIYYSGYHPYTGKECSRQEPSEKLAQRQFFFWYKPESRKQITESLKKCIVLTLSRLLYPHYRQTASKAPCSRKKMTDAVNKRHDYSRKSQTTIIPNIKIMIKFKITMSAIVALSVLGACNKQNTDETVIEKPEVTITDGMMTPEVLEAFGRISEATPSPRRN